MWLPIAGSHKFSILKCQKIKYVFTKKQEIMKRFYFRLITLSLALMVFAADGFSQKSILLVGRGNYDNQSDDDMFDSLTAWGYAPVFWTSENIEARVDDDFNDLDYSLYEAIVINESVDSKSMREFGTSDDYPLPCLNMEGFCVATTSDRWAWVDGDAIMQTASGGGTPDEQIFIVKDNSHYITQVFNIGDEIPWSNSTVEVEEIRPVSIQEGTVPFSAKLGQMKSHAGSADYWSMITVDEIGGPGNKLVFWGVSGVGLDGLSDNTGVSSGSYGTPKFYTLVRRSLEWILDETGGGVSVEAPLAEQMELVAYPNPASDRVTIRFRSLNAQPYTATLYNVAGQQVDLLKKQTHAGRNYLFLDANKYPSGIYQMRIDMEEGTAITKVVIQ
jgi:hypothetical protein